MIKTAIFILAVILISGCVTENAGNSNTAFECSTDSDCARATCCHPSDCVPKDKAPDCSGVMCTEECRSGTMDCGQGRCACVEGKCEVVWN